ncbi:MAG TPA: GGDEF domain-containing protein [Chromatiales bacterium]|nr:GGDEF domain-containing protein [Chromatiales bacterium]
MATQLHNIVENKPLPHRRLRDDEVHYMHDTAGQKSTAKVLKLTDALQRDLELDELLRNFDRQLKDIIKWEGMRYHCSAIGIDLIIGREERHSCSYQLEIEDAHLGELRFFSATPFSEQRLKQLENMLCALVYPLRNAIKYYEAVRSAFRDPLTGAENRAAMDTALKREIELSRRQGAPMSVILFDIDFFKRINDEFGHSAGDEALRSVVRCTNESIRSSDLLFRYGGEEFLILLSYTGAEGAKLLAERIRKHIEQSCPMADGRIHLTISLGVAELHSDENAEGLIERADAALYDAKHAGRNQVRSAD